MKGSNFFYSLIIGFFLLGSFSCGKSEDPNYNGNNPNGNGVLIYITSGMTFSPSVVTVKKGTTVTWRNDDTVVHTATSDDGHTFNSLDILIGGTYTFTPTVTGYFNYHCTHHSGMTGELRVTD